MPVSIQGNWTVTCIYKQQQALPQRFVISGATQGNGTYPGVEGSTIQVSGNNWQVNVQANEEYEETGKWINSDLIKTSVQAVGNQYIFQINSEDFLQDGSIDLILQCSQPIPIQPPPAAPPPSIPVPEPPPILPPVGEVPAPPPILPPTEMVSPGRVFTLIPEEDKLTKQRITLTKGLWSEGSGSLLTFFTGSQNAVSASYQLEVYNKSYLSCGSEKQFSISYGHDGGSGSRDLGGYDWMSPSNAVYGQYRSICLDYPQQRFRIGTKELVHFYAININQSVLGNSIDPGNIELNIAHLSGSLFQSGGGVRNAHTGSNVKLAGNGQILRLVDDSKLDYSILNSTALANSYSEFSDSFTNLVNSNGPYFFMVSGSLETGVLNHTNPEVYGILYPKLGVIILDGDKLDSTAGFLTVSGSDVAGDNARKLFTAVSGAALYTDASGDYLGFQARKLEYQYCENYFIRVKNQEYNFTNNPTYQTGSEGQIIDDFQGNPQVYMTQVGLYNQQKELLAVGKISMPLLKNYTTEALLQVSISY